MKRHKDTHRCRNATADICRIQQKHRVTSGQFCPVRPGVRKGFQEKFMS